MIWFRIIQWTHIPFAIDEMAWIFYHHYYIFAIIAKLFGKCSRQYDRIPYKSLQSNAMQCSLLRNPWVFIRGPNFSHSGILHFKKKKMSVSHSVLVRPCSYSNFDLWLMSFEHVVSNAFLFFAYAGSWDRPYHKKNLYSLQGYGTIEHICP